MGRIIQELERSLPGLSKAVFSQSIDKLSDEKVVVRPVSTKTGIAYQAESFRNNKAFHRNLTADELLRYAGEALEGRYRQVLIVSQSGGGRSASRSTASISAPARPRRSRCPAALPRMTARKNISCARGRTSQRLSTSGCSRMTSRSSAPSTASTGR